MRNLGRRDFRHILIIKPSSFGDVIHALPVLNGLRERFPTARIAWLVAHSCAGLLDGHPALDEVIPFDRKRYGLLGRRLDVTGDFITFVRSLRARRFDLVVDLQGLFRSGFLAQATGARVRIGFAAAREMAWMFYTDRVRVPHRDTHAVERNYRFGRALGFADVPIRFDLPVRPEARRAARGLLEREGLRPDEPYVLIGPGTRWETKMWPAAHFAAVARRLAADHGLRPVLVGMDSERDVAAQIAEHAGDGVVNLAGRTSLAELIALVDEAVVVLMHDSGPMHLATALNRPMVALYGPTSPVRTGPYGRRDAVARLDLACSPCYIKRVSACPHEHRCMRDLDPGLVLERVAALVGTGASVT